MSRLAYSIACLSTLVACLDGTPASCDADAGVAASMTITCGPGPTAVDDAGVAKIPICIRASVPCLRGTLQATVYTSAGQVGGADSGKGASVLLVPIDGGVPNPATVAAGQATLVLPAGTTGHLEAALGDLSAAGNFAADTCAPGGAGSDGGC